jgi:hypothetical protein
MEYPRPDWTATVASNLDISGAPSIVIGADDVVYFAVSTTGTFGTLAPSSTYDVVVGCMSGSGVLQWLFRDPQLVSGAGDTQPSLAIGNGGELYLAFVTPGAIPGRSNAADVPSLCGSCGATAGRQDIVLARIDGAPTGTPIVAWRVQDAYLNSCNNETAPRLHFDKLGNQLFLIYQTSGATLCNVSIGSPNIVLVAFDPTGYLTWSYQDDMLNAAGSNEFPAITTDGIGGVYLAYTHTTAVSGGGVMQGSKDVEVIRLHVEGSPVRVVRDWILSAGTIINSPGVNDQPHIVCDPVRNFVYLAFTATEAVPGGEKTAAISDIVFASFKADGTLLWLLQKQEFNEATYRYKSVDHPMLALDSNGALFSAAHAITDSTNDDMLLMIKINPGTQQGWYFRVTIAEVYRSYIPAANFTTPFQAVTATSPYSAPVVAVNTGHLYVGFVRQNISTFYLVGLLQVLNYQEFTAQQYMRSFTAICSSTRKL